MRIDADGVGLALHEDGPVDGPPVLLLHGIISSARTWEWMLPGLTDRFRVLRLDFRGHGESGRAPGRYQPSDYLADAVAACRAVGRPVFVVGHSLGGVTAAALAQQHPELVTSVVLEDAPLGPRPAPASPEAPHALRTMFAMLREMIPAFQAGGTTASVLAAQLSAAVTPTGSTLGATMHPDGIVSMAAGLLAVDATVLDPVLADEMRPAFDPSVPIEVPVVAVAADPAMPDAVTQRDDLLRLTDTSPKVTTYTMTGAGHLVHDTLAGREPFWSIVEEVLVGRSG